MTYAYTQDVPIDQEAYARITAGLGDAVPAGMLVHIALQRPEGGLRYLDVWESEDACNRFGEERLHPVVHPVLRDVFGDDAMPDEPERTPVTAIHVWHP